MDKWTVKHDGLSYTGYVEYEAVGAVQLTGRVDGAARVDAVVRRRHVRDPDAAVILGESNPLTTEQPAQPHSGVRYSLVALQQSTPTSHWQDKSSRTKATFTTTIITLRLDRATTIRRSTLQPQVHCIAAPGLNKHKQVRMSAGQRPVMCNELW